MVKNKSFNALIFFAWRYLFSILLFFPNILRYRKYGFLAYASIGHRNFSRSSTKIGKRVEIWGGTTIWVASEVEIGDFSQINPGCFISGKVTIGNNVMIGPGAKIIGGSHNYAQLDVPMRFQGGTTLPIVIEDDVWIGANAVILGGCNVGRGSIVAAGAVVTKSIKKFTVVGGVPGKIIKNRKTV